MKIVVDIPEEDYKETKMQIWMTGGMIETLGGRLKCAVANGTPLPKGHWILQDNPRDKLYGGYRCSECGAVIGEKANYCSERGADMREDRG